MNLLRAVFHPPRVLAPPVVGPAALLSREA